jgi:hypothetical protein
MMPFFSVKQARSAMLSLLILAFVVPTSTAVATTWDGETSTDWQTGTNWGGNVAPGPGDAAIINDGGLANQPFLEPGDTATIESLALSAGVLTLGGDLTATNGVVISGTGRLVGNNGFLNGNVDVTGGTVAGNLYISGNLNLSAPSTVLINVFAPSLFNQIVIGGNANLGGNLVINLGEYDGTTDVMFDLLTYDSRTAGSMFESWSVVGLTGLTTSLTYSDTGVRFRVLSAVPEPATWTMMIAGFGMVGGTIRFRCKQSLQLPA